MIQATDAGIDIDQLIAWNMSNTIQHPLLRLDLPAALVYYYKEGRDERLSLTFDIPKDEYGYFYNVHTWTGIIRICVNETVETVNNNQPHFYSRELRRASFIIDFNQLLAVCDNIPHLWWKEICEREMFIRCLMGEDISSLPLMVRSICCRIIELNQLHHINQLFKYDTSAFRQREGP